MCAAQGAGLSNLSPSNFSPTMMLSQLMATPTPGGSLGSIDKPSPPDANKPAAAPP